MESIRFSFLPWPRQAATRSPTSTAPAARRCRAVVEAMNDYLFHHNANTHWAYPTSEETDALIDDAGRPWPTSSTRRPTRSRSATNMTTLTFHLARALGRAWGAGDEIMVTELDHHGTSIRGALASEAGRDGPDGARCDADRGELDWTTLASS